MRGYAQDEQNQNQDLIDVPIEWLLQEDAIEKGKRAKQYKASRARKGKGKARLGTYDYLDREQRRSLRESGKVRVYNMNEILSLEAFKAKTWDEARELMIHWRNTYKNHEIVAGMGLTDHKALYNLLAKYEVPNKRPAPQKIVTTRIEYDEVDRIKNEGSRMDKLLSINPEQRYSILYYWFYDVGMTHKEVAELCKFNEEEYTKLHQQKYQMKKWAKKSDKLPDPEKDIKTQQKEIDERLEKQKEKLEQKAQIVPENKMAQPSETKAIRSMNDLRQEREQNETNEVARLKQEIQNLKALQHIKETPEESNGLNLAISGTYSGKHIAQRLQSLITVLENESSAFELSIDVKEVEADPSKPEPENPTPEDIREKILNLLGV